MMLLFWRLVIAGLILAIRWLLDQGKHARSISALEILKQRYAKGEIDKEEFGAKKRACPNRASTIRRMCSASSAEGL